MRVRFTLDYSEFIFQQALEAKTEDREKIIAYGEIIEDNFAAGEAQIVYVVEFGDEDGWTARGQAEETIAVIGEHASMERA